LCNRTTLKFVRQQHDRSQSKDLAMPDREESHRPQDRDFTIDQWEKFPFKRKDDPYENRNEDRAEKEDQSQYEYEGWEHNAFPNKDVSEQPAESTEDESAGS
jgi:hypothetical protein